MSKKVEVLKPTILYNLADLTKKDEINIHNASDSNGNPIPELNTVPKGNPFKIFPKYVYLGIFKEEGSSEDPCRRHGKHNASGDV